MELPHLGQQCSFAECKQLDFLPVACLKCKLLFCKEHYVDYQHNCAKSAVEENNDASNVDIGPKSFPCSEDQCKGKELTPIVCEKCELQFCLKHRLPGDHNCSSLPPEKSKTLTGREKVIKITGKELPTEKPTGKVGKKSAKTASKVLQMKLKMKALGESNVPITERSYFNVTLLTDNTCTPTFFSREYSIGKMIDLIAKYSKLQNTNHLTDAKKLRLFTVDDVMVPCDLKLKDVLEDTNFNLCDFGGVHVKYV